MKEHNPVIRMHRERKETRYFEMGDPRKGLTRKGILKTIRESGKRGLSIDELSWLTGVDILFILKALKQLKRDLISVRVNHAVYWCYPLRGWHSG